MVREGGVVGNLVSGSGRKVVVEGDSVPCGVVLAAVEVGGVRVCGGVCLSVRGFRARVARRGAVCGGVSGRP